MPIMFVVPKTSKPVSTGKPISTTQPRAPHFSRKPGHVPPGRVYKPKARRGRNMTLNNTRGTYQCVIFCISYSAFMILHHRSRKTTAKRFNKYIDKPCPRFTTTGAPLFRTNFSRPQKASILRSRVSSMVISIQCLHPFFPFVPSCDVSTNDFSRCLQSRTNLPLSTRPIEDCYLLELPAG